MPLLDGVRHQDIPIKRAMPKSVNGEYDRRDDYDFWRGLGRALGQENDWPWESLEEVYDYRLRPMGVNFQKFMNQGGFLLVPRKLKRCLQEGFATPTGKVELYCTALEKLGYDPLPHYQEPPETPFSCPDLAEEYPLILITGGRHQPYYHSEQRQVQSLPKMHPDPLVQIHPDTAKRLDFRDDTLVWIESPRRRIKQRCRIFEAFEMTMRPWLLLREKARMPRSEERG